MAQLTLLEPDPHPTDLKIQRFGISTKMKFGMRHEAVVIARRSSEGGGRDAPPSLGRALTQLASFSENAAPAEAEEKLRMTDDPKYEAAKIRERAGNIRRLAKAMDGVTQSRLMAMAMELEAEALRLEGRR
jgi:hypothetical protein